MFSTLTLVDGLKYFDKEEEGVIPFISIKNNGKEVKA